jgi:hypothetical protein
VGQQRRFFAIAGDVYDIVLLFQALLDESRNLPVVFYHENLHR